jgi:integrase
MKGCRAFTDDEVTRVSQAFRGTYAAWDRELFLRSVKTGYRISELLSLQVGDVGQHGGVSSAWRPPVTTRKGNLKARVSRCTARLKAR